MSEQDSIQGYKIDLPADRHVWVGKLDDSHLVQFKNAEGALTHLRLSTEAATALRVLLADPQPTPAIIKRYLFCVATAGTESKGMVHWEAIETDTAPEPAIS